MTEIWIAPDQLFDGQSVLSGQAIRIVDNTVVDVAKAPGDARRINGCLSPGFVDLQVNGGGGVMLNTTPTVDGLSTIEAAHRKFGTTAIMPTVITDKPEVLDHAAEAILSARHQDGIIGLHIEGPHISTARRGTHNEAHIRRLDARTMDVVSRLRQNDVTVMITVAPEASTSDQIAAVSKMGAIVSIGHTDASAEDVETAIAAGATCATHLFNAMSPMTGRAPGAVGAIINSTVRAGIICDGHHVDDRMIKLALRARPQNDLMFLVSDAMATVGGPDRFDLYGQEIRLENGQLINAEGNLAGAHVTQGQGVKRLVKQVGLTLQEALRMAITTPAAVVGQEGLATLIGKHPCSLAVLTEDLCNSQPLTNAMNALGSGASDFRRVS